MIPPEALIAQELQAWNSMRNLSSATYRWKDIVLIANIFKREAYDFFMIKTSLFMMKKHDIHTQNRLRIQPRTFFLSTCRLFYVSSFLWAKSFLNLNSDARIAVTN
jgi:hypothetical protein